VTITAFSVGVWYAYDQGVKQGIRVKPPLIKAEPGPTKVVPENPGGLQVPNQDKQVFGRIDSAPPEPKVERLLPPQETPLPEKPESIETQPPAPMTEVPAPKATADAPTTPAETATEEPSEPEIAIAQPNPKPEPTSKLAAGTIRVQLAAFRDEQVARAGWDKLTGKYGSLLSDLKPFVVRVDLGKEKGIFYRLQAGPLKDEKAAEKLCDSLKAQKQSCLVIDSEN
jgi:cell division septation protein DedD